MLVANHRRRAPWPTRAIAIGVTVGVALGVVCALGAALTKLIDMI